MKPQVKKQSPTLAAKPYGQSQTTGNGTERIILPGLRAGLLPQDYQPLLNLYEETQAARELLLNYAKTHGSLAQHSKCLTALTPSNLQENLFYKREDQTCTKAYKVRGALVAMHRKKEKGYKRFLAVSTGNHALGVLKAAQVLNVEHVRIVVPENTSPAKISKMQLAIEALPEGTTAEIVFKGQTFDDAKAWAKTELQLNPDEGYIDPYSDADVVSGQGTIGLELLDQLKRILTDKPEVEEVLVVAPIGGGGLISGLANGLQMAAGFHPQLQKIRWVFLGVRLLDLESQLGDAIRVVNIAKNNRNVFSSLGIQILLMSDGHMQQGCDFVQQDIQQKVEGASGGTLYPTLWFDQYHPTPERLVVCVLSGANV